MGPRHNLSFCACNTAWLAPELLISKGPSPHLWFLHAKQLLLDQCTSLYWYQTSPVVLCMQNSVICTRMTSLYGFQPSSLDLCMQNSDFRTRLTSLYGSQPSSVVLSTHNSVLSPRINRLYVTWFAKIDHFPHFGEVELLPPYSFPGIWEHVKKFWRRSDLPLWRYTAKYSLF